MRPCVFQGGGVQLRAELDKGCTSTCTLAGAYHYRTTNDPGTWVSFNEEAVVSKGHSCPCFVFLPSLLVSIRKASISEPKKKFDDLFRALQIYNLIKLA